MNKTVNSTITRDDVLDTIKLAEGRIFNATFVKANGKIRKLTCRKGVKSRLKGGTSTTSHISKYITVFDMIGDGYKTINKDTLISLQINGYTVYVI